MASRAADREAAVLPAAHEEVVRGVCEPQLVADPERDLAGAGRTRGPERIPQVLGQRAPELLELPLLQHQVAAPVGAPQNDPAATGLPAAVPAAMVALTEDALAARAESTVDSSASASTTAASATSSSEYIAGSGAEPARSDCPASKSIAEASSLRPWLSSLLDSRLAFCVFWNSSSLRTFGSGIRPAASSPGTTLTITA